MISKGGKVSVISQLLVSVIEKGEVLLVVVQYEWILPVEKDQPL